MIDLLRFIFAIAVLIVAFKLTMGCLKIVLWLFGVIFLLSAIAAILI